MPFEIYYEIIPPDGPLRDWLLEERIQEVLILEEEVDRGLFNHVLAKAYAADRASDGATEAAPEPPIPHPPNRLASAALFAQTACG